MRYWATGGCRDLTPSSSRSPRVPTGPVRTVLGRDRVRDNALVGPSATVAAVALAAYADSPPAAALTTPGHPAHRRCGVFGHRRTVRPGLGAHGGRRGRARLRAESPVAGATAPPPGRVGSPVGAGVPGSEVQWARPDGVLPRVEHRRPAGRGRDADDGPGRSGPARRGRRWGGRPCRRWQVAVGLRSRERRHGGPGPPDRFRTDQTAEVELALRAGA